MSNLSITIVTGPFYPLPPGPAGSVEKIWARLAEEFAQRGHSVTVLSRRYRHLPVREVSQQNITIVRKTSFARTGSRACDLFLEAFYALAMAVSLPKSDVIVTNTIFLPILTPWLKRRVGKTVVSVERFPKGQLWCYARCARLRTTSKAVDNAARRQLPSAGPLIRRIPNPVDLSIFTPPQEPRNTPESGTVMYAGRIHPEKGLAILIQAFRMIHARYPGTRLKLVGPQETGRGGGGSEYVEELRRLAQGTPVTFIPNIEDPQKLAELFQQASIFCYPSIAEKGESFPVAPLEAMATGLPSILSKLPVFEDLLEHGVTGLTFDHKSAHPEENLAKAMQLLIENRAAWKEMSEQAAAKAGNFGYNTIAEAFLDDFQALTRTGNHGK